MSAPPDPGSVRTILVRANNWIGDVVLASPALHALRLRFPGARISILARPAVTPALDGSSDVDEIIPITPAERHPGGFLRLTRALRVRRFDLAVLFQKAFEAALIARLSGARRIYGYATDRRSWLLTDPIPETAETRARHHALVFLDLAAAAGADVSDRTLRFPLSETDRRGAAAALWTGGLREGEPFVAVHPGASKPPRAWHPERLGDAARRLSLEIGGRVVAVGGPPDASACSVAAGTGGVDLCGRTSVGQMAGVFEKARLVIASDSGPMHVAAAVGAPVVGIFGPGRPEKTAPFVAESRYAAIGLRFPCSPCRQDFFNECDPAPSGKPWCLEEIDVERVVAAARPLLVSGDGASPCA